MGAFGGSEARRCGLVRRFHRGSNDFIAPGSQSFTRCHSLIEALYTLNSPPVVSLESYPNYWFVGFIDMAEAQPRITFKGQ